MGALTAILVVLAAGALGQQWCQTDVDNPWSARRASNRNYRPVYQLKTSPSIAGDRVDVPWYNSSMWPPESMLFNYTRANGEVQALRAKLDWIDIHQQLVSSLVMVWNGTDYSNFIMANTTDVLVTVSCKEDTVSLTRFSVWSQFPFPTPGANATIEYTMKRFNVTWSMLKNL